MSDAVFTLRDLRADFATGRGDRLEVLGGIDLAVQKGEFLSLVGPSGCGKTTLLHVLNGLLAPSGGALEGAPESVALVFQRPQLLPWRTVVDNATFGLECRGTSQAEARAAASTLLARMGLGDHLSDYPHQLSEGMQQRVNLARALLVRPDLLLLDEPFSALDVRTRRALQDDLLAEWRERGITVVLVSHALEDVVYLSDRVGVLSDKPTRLVELVEIDLPRPRARDPETDLEVARRVAALANTLTNS